MESESSLPGPVGAFLQKIQDRFPERPDVCEYFETNILKPISDGQAAKDFITLVSRVLRRAPELVREFGRTLDSFDQLSERGRQRLAAELVFISDDDTDNDTDDDIDDDTDDSMQIEQKGHHEDVQKLLILPDVDIPQERRKQTPRGMSCELMEHQKACLTWLVQQEEDKHKKGGLLAVAPLALLRQWEQEIASKVKPQYKLRTVILHGPKAKKMTVTHLLEHDVVFCTYGKLQQEYKAKNERTRPPVLRILHPRATFYRVILDEAHNIKNKDAIASRAAAEIQSQYRLCMTGTPFMNQLREIFPLIRFLHISPYNEWQRFNEEIAGPMRKWDGDEKQAGLLKLQALFRSITIRRTKDSRIDGRPIIENLPARQEKPAQAKFDDEQGAFYHALETEQRLEFNNYLMAGSVMKHYAEVMVLLLRLRQACAHPFLIKNHGIPEGTKLGAQDMITLACKLPENVVATIKVKEIFECPWCDGDTGYPIIIHPCGHYICPECFTARMADRESERLRIGDEEEGGEGEDEDGSDRFIPCPHDGCDNEVMPSNIICHNFFVDAHMADGSKGGAAEDETDEEVSDQDDDADENGNLRDFVVDSEDEASLADDESGSEGDGVEWELHHDSRMVSKTTGTGGTSTHSPSGYDSAVESPYSVDGSVSVDEISEDVTRPLPAEPVHDDSSSESSLSSDNMTNNWRRSEMEKLKRLVRVLNNDTNEDMVDITDIQLQARPPKRKKSAGKATGISRKKPRSDCQDTDVDSARNRRCKAEGVVRHHIEPPGPRRTRPGNKRGGKKKGKGRRKDNDFLSFGEMKRVAQRSAAAMSRYKQRLRKEWVSSCKVDKTMEILEDIRAHKPEEKTLVFSLWTSFLDLLEIPIENAGINYTRYDGSMKVDARDAAVSSFMTNPDIKVMLLSLTAGNAGLNLTAASHVIILEPFWNPFVEEQAIDRAHRIGQKREVTVHRVLIANTVEDRILRLQEGKKLLVNAALSEKGAQSVSKLGVQDLRKLFGI